MNIIEGLVWAERSGLVTREESDKIWRQLCLTLGAKRWLPKVQARMEAARERAGMVAGDDQDATVQG